MLKFIILMIIALVLGVSLGLWASNDPQISQHDSLNSNKPDRTALKKESAEFIELIKERRGMK